MTDNFKRGLFLTVEGGDGAGKTTAVKLLKKIMEREKIETLFTREPGGTNIAETIRDCLFKCVSTDEEVMHPMTELLLVSAARYQHVQNFIKPTLNIGQWVVSDRFNDSTWAYQRYAGKLSTDEVVSMEDLVIGHFQPDIVIILDADPEKVQHRMKGRADNNGFDERDMEFKKDVREGLLKRANRKTRTQYYIIDTVVHNEHQVEILLESIVKENHFLWKHEWCPEYRTYPYRAEIVQHIDILGEAEKNENS